MGFNKGFIAIAADSTLQELLLMHTQEPMHHIMLLGGPRVFMRGTLTT